MGRSISENRSFHHGWVLVRIGFIHSNGYIKEYGRCATNKEWDKGQEWIRKNM